MVRDFTRMPNESVGVSIKMVYDRFVLVRFRSH